METLLWPFKCLVTRTARLLELRYGKSCQSAASATANVTVAAAIARASMNTAAAQDARLRRMIRKRARSSVMNSMVERRRRGSNVRSCEFQQPQVHKLWCDLTFV